jgi:thiamine biosynthesis lipoprotein
MTNLTATIIRSCFTLLTVSALVYVAMSPRFCLAYLKYQENCMGTQFTLLIDHDDEVKAKIGAKAAFEEAKRLDLVFSDYLGDSELSMLSDSSYTMKKQRLSDDLFSVLKHGQVVSRDTNGSFDMTLGQLSRLWRIARFKKAMPSQEKLSRAMAMTGYKHLKLFPKTKEARLTLEGIELDLGGIAKGYTADRMLKILRKHGLSRCVIDAGGDLVIGDPPRKSDGWRIKVGGLEHSASPYLELSNCAAATSGDIEQFVILNGKRFSHLIDPFSGLGLTTQAQVTIIAPTGIVADSLASACIVLGVEKAQRYLRNQRQTKAYFMLRNDGQVDLTYIVSD